MAQASFSFQQVVLRWCAASFLVLATYNPSGSSYYHWLTNLSDHRWSLKVLVGVVLLILNLTFMFATFRSMGAGGVISGVAFCGSVVWTLLDNGYLTHIGAWTWVTLVLALAASIIAFGVSWSHIRAVLAGQIDSNDVTQ